MPSSTLKFTWGERSWNPPTSHQSGGRCGGFGPLGGIVALGLEVGSRGGLGEGASAEGVGDGEARGRFIGSARRMLIWPKIGLVYWLP